jgi:hypothetical protein
VKRHRPAGVAQTGATLWAQDPVSGHYAGVFSGSVLMQRPYCKRGSKSSAIRGSDSLLRRLYSLESPESWFEDFDTTQIRNGRYYRAVGARLRGASTR